jgi:TonB family protein
MHIAGAILVSVTIDATGRVTKAESTSGNKLLVGAAIDAVKQWKFAPGDGTETMTVTINFENS